MTPRAVRPAHSDGRRVRLVVVEDGARVGDSHLSPDADGREDTIVVRQLEGDLPTDLAQRAIGRIATIERSGSGVARAVILVGPRRDPQLMASRQLLARAFLMHAHVSLAESAELVLVGDGNAEAALRHELFALVDVLVGDPASHSVSIRVRFASLEPPSSVKSGIHRIPAGRPAETLTVAALACASGSG